MNYKTKDFIFKDNKDKLKNNILNEYGYNFDSIKRSNITFDYSRVYYHVNKEYIRNYKNKN